MSPCNCIWHQNAARMCPLRNLNMRIGVDRLKTFQTSGSAQWLAKKISIVDMADAGFFYTSKGDRVECFYCQVRIFDWQIGNSPAEEHRKYRPNCGFVLGQRTQNVPIIQNPFQDCIDHESFDYPCCQ